MDISFFRAGIVLQKSRAYDVDVPAGPSNPGDVDRRVADRVGQQQCDGGGHHDTTDTTDTIGRRRLDHHGRLGSAGSCGSLDEGVGRIDQLDPHRHRHAQSSSPRCGLGILRSLRGPDFSCLLTATALRVAVSAGTIGPPRRLKHAGAFKDGQFVWPHNVDGHII
jgi:hypothetical protein